MAICLIGIIGVVSANPHASVNYEIFEDKALVEINFGSVEDFEYKLPNDARTLEVNSAYELEEFADYKLLTVKQSNNLAISYITNSVIDKTNTKSYFILRNNFNDSVSLMLYLPEGGILGDIVVPDADSMSTDGRRVILSWNNLTEEEVVVSYEIVKGNTIFWINLILILVVIALVVYIISFRKLKLKILKLKKKTKVVRKKSEVRAKKDVVRNLFGEEKQVIEYLLGKKGHESWTKEIVRDLNISKVRLSRRLRNLIQKELIEKVPYGNENRIRLLKTK